METIMHSTRHGGRGLWCAILTAALLLPMAACVSATDQASPPFASVDRGSGAKDARPGARFALVIGNSRYRHLDPLANPPNDAAAVARRLRDLGFTLIGADGRPTDGAVRDLDEAGFVKAVRTFAQRVQGAEIALLFYAGHGMQIAGQPYLLPVDAPSDDLGLLRRRSLALEEVLNDLDGQAALTVAVFDACREIPKLRSVVAATRGTGGGARDDMGMRSVQSQGRSRIIAYSGAAGQVVPDGAGLHSPYSRLLLEQLAQPEPVERLFQRVAWQLSQHGGQSPELSIQGVEPDRFYLASPVKAVASAPPPPPRVSQALDSVASTFGGPRAETPTPPPSVVSAAPPLALSRVDSAVDDIRQTKQSIGTPDQPMSAMPPQTNPWLSSNLYGSDNEYAALRSVTIIPRENGFLVTIKNQFNFQCKLSFDSANNPEFLSDCRSLDGPQPICTPDMPGSFCAKASGCFLTEQEEKNPKCFEAWEVKESLIHLKCSVLKTEQVCHGFYTLAKGDYDSKSRMTIARRTQ
ncbi:caspase family protein [Thiocystis violacea]|uniref:caspase family protein n=1 Tax=Thiocystis violacea TaxID=13725 RepID=UPI0019062224|nr:caspase family protein [Thiocystis violacea]MBK1720097.1 hypothetical protein [Thiocystis violacea]